MPKAIAIPARGRVVTEQIESLVLRGNRLGDPARRAVAVYLPPGYDEGGARYPSAYVLAGYNARGSMLLNESAWDENIAERMDRLIASGAVQPMILVLPDCLTAYGGSQYINSEASGRYEDHLVDEVLPHIDATFRTLAQRDARAVLGKSSGGYGALMLAMRHPGLFGLTASHSGDLYFELCYKSAFPGFVRDIGHLGGLAAFLSGLRSIRPRDARYNRIVNTIAMASCYSPNGAAEHGFDLPFDLATGELNETVWARWLRHDPVHLAAEHAAALKSLRLIYLDAGSDDEFNLQLGARVFCAKLSEQGIGFHHEEFKDGHLNIPYRFDVSLRAISERMITDQAPASGAA